MTGPAGLAPKGIERPLKQSGPGCLYLEPKVDSALLNRRHRKSRAVGWFPFLLFPGEKEGGTHSSVALKATRPCSTVPSPSHCDVLNDAKASNKTAIALQHEFGNPKPEQGAPASRAHWVVFIKFRPTEGGWGEGMV